MFANITFSYRMRQILLLLGDFTSYYAGFILALGLRTLTIPTIEQIVRHLSPFTVVFCLWIIANYITGLYDLRLMTLNSNTRRTIESAVVAFIVGMIFFYLIPSDDISPKTILLLTTVIGFGIATLFRTLYLTYIGTHKLKTRILFLGVTDEVKELISIIANQPNLGYHVSTVIDPDTHFQKPPQDEVEVYYTLNTLRPAIDTQHIHTVVVAPGMSDREEVRRELYELLFWQVQILDMTSFYETVTGRIPPSTFSESWFLSNLQTAEHPVYAKAKRGTDIMFGFLFGLTFIVLFPFLAIAIKLSSPGPIFFKQQRGEKETNRMVGEGGKIFWMYKLRTMYVLAEDGSAETHGYEFAKKNDNRITSVGKFLRKTRLDELPQAFNLIKGDVTLVGPRPERPEIVEKLTELMPYYPLRHIIKPGITGWAAIQQHYTEDLESSLKKLQYDLYYIKNKSALLDLSIILRTINVVLRGMGQ